MKPFNKLFYFLLQFSQKMSQFVKKIHRNSLKQKKRIKTFSLFLFSFFLGLYFTHQPFNFLPAHSVAIAQQSTPATPPEVNPLDAALANNDPTAIVNALENNWESDYETYFGTNFIDLEMTAADISTTLDRIWRESTQKPALLYLLPRPNALELVLVTPNNPPLRASVTDAPHDQVMEVIQGFMKELHSPIKRRTKSYQPSAQQLYQWMIAPVEAELEKEEIDTLILCMGAGLRNLPMVALHDGEKFLIEKYSIGRIPAFKLAETRYQDLRNAKVLAMGASIFTEMNPLPAVPVELTTILQSLPGLSFLNRSFTVANLQQQRQQEEYSIIHLATHATFQSGSPDNSFIQFWNSQLTLDRMSHLGWQDPQVELLVLSACTTAVSDPDAEMGFGGLAVQSGARSALASLWAVSDLGTLALMQEFYQQLKTAPTRSEALRRAQVAMIHGTVDVDKESFPPETRQNLGDENLAHPFYWAAFTMIGSLW